MKNILTALKLLGGVLMHPLLHFTLQIIFVFIFDLKLIYLVYFLILYALTQTYKNVVDVRSREDLYINKAWSVKGNVSIVISVILTVRIFMLYN